MALSIFVVFFGLFGAILASLRPCIDQLKEDDKRIFDEPNELQKIIPFNFSKECGKVYGSGISNDDQKLIVNKHNELRKLIAKGKILGQPRGVNLKKMKYDYSLAAKAQMVANSCIFDHQTITDGRWHGVGQNLYMLSSTAYFPQPDWSAAIKSWSDEHKLYIYGRLPRNRKYLKKIGHYTQMVWADTEYVGCGYTFFSGDSYWRYKTLYVCNYGPSGNYLGQLPYKRGSSGCEDLC